jgi:hypothetical protein
MSHAFPGPDVQLEELLKMNEGAVPTQTVRKQWLRFQQAADQALQRHLSEDEYDELSTTVWSTSIPVYQTVMNMGTGVWDKWDRSDLSLDAAELNEKLKADPKLIAFAEETGTGSLQEALTMPSLKDLASYVDGTESSVEGVKVLRRPNEGIQLDLGDSFVHLYPYEDGTWWWQKGDGQGLLDENQDGQTFKVALRSALASENPGRRRNPTEVDHETEGIKALRNAEEYWRGYINSRRRNTKLLVDSYKFLVIAHEELKYSGQSAPRLEADHALKRAHKELSKQLKG